MKKSSAYLVNVFVQPPKKNTGESDLKKKNKESADEIVKMLQQKNDRGDKISKDVGMPEDAPSTSNGNRTEKVKSYSSKSWLRINNDSLFIN